jgi:hypothetical protein
MYETNWWSLLMLFAVCLVMVVIAGWVGFTFGSEYGKREQAQRDGAQHVARMREVTRQKQELWFQLDRMRRAWKAARSEVGLGDFCEACDSSNLTNYCKDCGSIQVRKQLKG